MLVVFYVSLGFSEYMAYGGELAYQQLSMIAQNKLALVGVQAHEKEKAETYSNTVIGGIISTSEIAMFLLNSEGHQALPLSQYIITHLNLVICYSIFYLFGQFPDWPVRGRLKKNHEQRDSISGTGNIWLIRVLRWNLFFISSKMNYLGQMQKRYELKIRLPFFTTDLNRFRYKIIGHLFFILSRVSGERLVILGL
ncbi:hypothetical protein ACJX0J_015850 [Zea mays]